MTEYRGLTFRTRDGRSPQGRQRVYFCAHPDDFNAYFNTISTEVLDIQPSAVIWYHDPSEGIPPTEPLLDDLAQMQLFVVPVTARFLHEENQARTVELAFAQRSHIPVLPLMQEPGLEEDFNELCGGMQFLDKHATESDPTAIPYQTRLRKFLRSVLIGDELAARVRAAFDAYVFLSYRKKDRALAQQVMRLIHRNAFCRDVAIWYDEFLVPGESFDEAILDAMRSSSLFALIVTPSVTEDPNYVVTNEYPEARRLGKPVLPIEVQETDLDELARLCDGIGRSVPADNPTALALRLKQELRKVALMTHVGDPAHDYLVGLAYLSGIDVEVDHERAVELITGAAEAGVMEACERLVAMYNTGDGVERNPVTAYAWCERAVELAHDRALADDSPENLRSLHQALIDLLDGRFVAHSTLDPKYRTWYDEVNARLEEFIGLMHEGIDGPRFIESGRVQKEGERWESKGELGKAFECYRRALELREQLALEADTPVAWENLLRTYTILLDPPARAIPADVRSEWLKRMAGTARMALDRFGMLRFSTFANFAESYLESPELYSIASRL